MHCKMGAPIAVGVTVHDKVAMYLLHLTMLQAPTGSTTVCPTSTYWFFLSLSTMQCQGVGRKQGVGGKQGHVVLGPSPLTVMAQPPPF